MLYSQKAPIFHAITLFLQLVVSLGIPDISDRSIIFDSLVQLPCSTVNGSPALTPGSSILTQPSSQKLTVAVWFKPKSYENFDEHTLFSIHESGSLNLIYSLSYSMQQGAAYNNIKGTPHTKPITFDILYWAFIRSIIELSPTAGGYDYVYSEYGTTIPLTAETVQQISLSGSVMTLDRNNILLNFGYSSNLLPTLKPACARVRMMVIYFNDQPISDSSAAVHHTKSAASANLISHFDSFYSDVNLQTFMNFSAYQLQWFQLDFTSTSPLAILNGKRICINSYNQNDKIGLIIYFEFLYNRFSTDPVQLIALSIGGTEQIVVKVNSLGIVQIATNSFATIVQGSRYQIALIIDGINGETATCLIYDYTSVLLGREQIIGTKLESFEIFLSSTTNLNTLELNNIRVYSGSLVGETSNCFLQTIGDKENHCLFCKPTYVLSYEKNMTCVLRGSVPSTLVYNIADWSRASCPAEMLHMNRTPQCLCQFSKYLSVSTCTKCPLFCNGCRSANNCIEKDINRNQLTGRCVGDYFDDGYKCLARTLAFPNAGIFGPYFDSSGFFSSKTIGTAELNLSSNDSFMMEIHLKKPSVNLSYVECIGYFRNDSQDFFLVLIIGDSVSNIYKACIKLYGQTEQCIHINLNSQTSIGIWFSFSKVIFAVRNQTLNSHFNLSFSPPSLVYVSPEICGGDCLPLVIGSIIGFRGGSSIDYLKFIKGINDPSNSIQDFYSILQYEGNVIGHFILSTKPSATDNIESTNDVPNSASPSMSFLMKFNQSDRLKGAVSYFNSLDQNSGIVNLLSNIPDASYSMNIFIESMELDTMILDTRIDFTTVLQFILKTDTILGASYLWVCLEVSCYSTQYCKVHFHQPNFLAFFSRIEMYHFEQSSLNYYEIEIEVVCNYQRETLKWLNQKQLITSNLVSVSMWKALSDTHVYFNNLRLIQGSDVYFDYQSSEKCFLFVGVVQRRCIKAKEGFSLYQHKAISISECEIAGNATGDGMTFHNQYTGECENSGRILPGCKIINSEGFSCKVCQDEYADPNKNCDCYPECHIKCSTCFNSFDNCMICKFDNTSPPSCQCNLQGQYRDPINYVCKDCDFQCQTCEISADNCLSCSPDRINPPVCMCNPQYFSESTGVCQQYDCSYQCDSCENSTRNCVSCSKNRSNPPDCVCDESFFEKDKECIQCPVHNYFDKTLNACKPCSSQCVSCSDTKTQCTECLPELFLYKQSCLCSDLTSFKVTSTGDVVCDDEMNVKLEAKSKNNVFTIVLTFDTRSLVAIDFTQIEIDKLIFVYFSMISQDSFSLVNPRMENGNQIAFEIEFKQSFAFRGGYLIFTSRQEFQSESDNLMLASKYLADPISFNLSPIILSNDLWTRNESIEKATDFVDNSNIWFYIIQQFQLFFYLLNTLQQTVVFLLIDTAIPPNFYQPLQFIGKFAFNVQNYGETKVKSDFTFLGKDLDLQSEYSLNSNKIFNRIEFSGAMLVNIPLSVFLFFLWPAINVLLFKVYRIINERSFKQQQAAAGLCQDDIQVKLKEDPTIIKKLAPLMYARINSGLETSLLLFTLSSFNQIQNIDGELILNRMSLLLAILIILTTIYYNKTNYQSLMRSNGIKQPFLEAASLNIIEKLDYSKKKKLAVVYLYYQTIKKYLIAISIVFFTELPQVICILSATLSTISILFTCVQRPYKQILNNLIKVIGETCIIGISMIYYFIFIPFDNLIKGSSIVEVDDVSSFLFYGRFALILIVTYNVLYMFEFTYTQIILRIKSKKNKPGDRTNDLRKIDNNQSNEQIQELNPNTQADVRNYIKYNQLSSAQRNLKINKHQSPILRNPLQSFVRHKKNQPISSNK